MHRIPAEMVDRVSTHLLRLAKALRANVSWDGPVTPVPKVLLLLMMISVYIHLLIVSLLSLKTNFQIDFIY